MNVADAIGLVIFLLIGYAPLWFAIRARRRWVRIVLALAATLLLPLVASLLLLAGSADQIQDGPVPLVMIVLATACGISALVALAFVFIAPPAIDAQSGYASTKSFSPDNQDLKPKP